jgi:hypothetical protein
MSVYYLRRNHESDAERFQQAGEISISTPMTEKEVKTYLTAFEESLAEVKPFVEETTPHLIR